MTSMDYVSDKGVIDRVIALAATHAPHRLPLYRAARDGTVMLVEVPRGATVPMRLLKRRDRPLIVLLADDDHLNTGPDAFPCMRRLRPWMKTAIVDAAGGEEKHYAAAVAAALLKQRLVFIETGTQHQDAWMKEIPEGLPTLCIQVRDGIHPVMPALQ